MTRGRALVVGLVAALAVVAVAIPAPASTSPTGKTWTSYLCHSKIKKYDARSWGCATMTIDPVVVETGGSITVSYSFKAKIRLTHLSFCLGEIRGDGKLPSYCSSWHRRISVLPKGHVVKATVTVPVPTTLKYGSGQGYGFPSYTHFYKKMKRFGTDTHTDFWTLVHSAAICIYTPDDPTACSQ